MKTFIPIFLFFFLFTTTIPCQTFKDDSMAVTALFEGISYSNDSIRWD